jgi:hypothetical protein
MTAVAFSGRIVFTNQDGTLTREATSLLQSLLNRTGGNVFDIAASAVSFSPTGGITSLTVQQMGAELDAEKVSTTRTINGHALSADVTLTSSDVGAQPHDTDLDAWAGKTAPTGTVVGTTDAQTLTNKTLTSGGVALTSGTIGYAAGNGGTVTQALNKGTGVTLNKITGEITLNAAGLAANTAVTFTLTNSTIAATDRIVLNHISGGTFTAYALDAQPGAGSALIGVRNLTAGSLSEAIVVGFTVIKAANT